MTELSSKSLNPGIQLSGKHSSCRKTGPRTDGFVHRLLGKGLAIICPPVRYRTRFNYDSIFWGLTTSTFLRQLTNDPFRVGGNGHPPVV